MRKNSKGFAPILVIVVIIIVAVIGYIAYQNYYAQKGTILGPYTPSPAATPVPTVSPAAGAKTNLKTYTNTKYGFSLQYPNDWKIQEPAKSESNSVVLLTSPETQKIMDANGKLTTQLGMIPIGSDIAINIETLEGNPSGSGSGSISLMRSGQIGDPANAQIFSQAIVGSQSFTVAKIMADPSYLTYVLKYKNYYWAIDFVNIQSPNSLTSAEKQILSTFKFTN